MSNPLVELHINNYGVITLELDSEKAPKSVENFLSYVAQGHYDMRQLRAETPPYSPTSCPYRQFHSR